jgi:hypothetical protein
LETVLDQLKEVEDFFQPAVLLFMCELANVHDSPKKRKYEAKLMSILCKRGKGKISKVEIPRRFKVPDRNSIEAFRRALIGISEQRSAAIEER